MALFEVKNSEFVWDGKPVRIRSGALHYFRVVPEYWRDRLLKLKACGLNTVETYVPWNLHEPKEGRFNFTGIADVVAFIRLAGELGLHVIVRPSPYICAEWEFGGLPAWLLADANLRLRCSDPLFLAKVDAYYDVLLPLLAPLQCTQGGPIIAMQVENEYGSYGNDRSYLLYLKQAMEQRGIDVLLFTSDGPEDFMLQGGMIPGVLATINFGSDPLGAFAKLKEYRPDDPLMVTEFWNGWFDHWMEEHHVRGADDTAETLAQMLGSGASFNLYMFHGGTNFGFYNGANHIQTYEPTVGSYDYNALLSEDGEPTDKYFAVREAIGKFEPLEPLALPEALPKQAYGRVALSQTAGLFDHLSELAEPRRRPVPLPMEQLGQEYGFILYSTVIPGPRAEMELTLQQVSDRAIVFADGRCLGTIDRWAPSALPLSVPPEGVRLDILVENMGRINYGPLLRDPKGITEGVRHGNQFLYGWTIYTLPLDTASLARLSYSPLAEAQAAGQRGEAQGAERRGEQDAEQRVETLDAGRRIEVQGAERRIETPGAEQRVGIQSAKLFESDAAKLQSRLTGPAFYRGSFRINDPAPADTFLRLDGWTKGVAYINGFNLGRYWNAGPQRTLYIPAPLLKSGDNEIVLFELHGAEKAEVRLTDQADLG